MNHIAHFLLAPHTGDGAIGTLLADFHRGPISLQLPKEVAAAIALHRAIDSHTDRHPATREAKTLFAAGSRRYAGVALDLYFDHCLVRGWANHAAMPFPEFVAATYERLIGGLEGEYIPDRMRRMAHAMQAEDWLGAYRDFDGVERALGRLNHAIRHRFGREVDLLPLADELRRLGPRLDAAFSVLFPDVARLAET
jgi:acyl carrier protein phosphodiesterase